MSTNLLGTSSCVFFATFSWCAMEDNNNTNPAKKMKQEWKGPRVHLRILPDWVKMMVHC